MTGGRGDLLGVSYHCGSVIVGEKGGGGKRTKERGKDCMEAL